MNGQPPKRERCLRACGAAGSGCQQADWLGHSWHEPASMNGAALRAKRGGNERGSRRPCGVMLTSPGRRRRGRMTLSRKQLRLQFDPRQCPRGPQASSGPGCPLPLLVPLLGPRPLARAAARPTPLGPPRPPFSPNYDPRPSAPCPRGQHRQEPGRRGRRCPGFRQTGFALWECLCLGWGLTAWPGSGACPAASQS